MADLELARIRDQLAPHWDGLFGSQSPAAAPVRQRCLTEATNKFSPGAWILHLGCGTGEDTVEIARQGVRVWALDWSPRMVEATQARVDAAGLSDGVKVLTLAPRAVGTLVGAEIPAERLDGAFAPWGALNQEQDLPALFDGLYRLLRPSGLVIATLLNARSLFGALGAMAGGQVKEGLRRLRGDGERQAEWSLGPDLPGVPVAFPTPDSLKEIYGTRFKVEKNEPLGVISPAAGRSRLGDRGGRILPRLGRALSPLPTSRAFSDQSLVVIRRTIEGVWGPAGPHYLAN